MQRVSVQPEQSSGKPQRGHQLKHAGKKSIDGPLLRQCDLDLILRAEEIEREDAKEAGAIGYMARAIIQATMPHSDPGTGEFRRKNGNYTLVMLAPSDIGLPYGSIPRLVLSWISTEAVRTKEPTVVLGDTLSSFMRELDLVPTGGRWGTITRLRNQMQRLFSTSISCTYDGDRQWANTGFRIADETHLWWHPKDPDQFDLWQSTVTLGSRFFRELVDHPVPVDMRALRALRRSPMALDLYCWLTYRMSYLRKETVIPWPALQAQFGADYARNRAFKGKFVESLRKVLTVYTEAKASLAENGLLVKPSRTHIRR